MHAVQETDTPSLQQSRNAPEATVATTVIQTETEDLNDSEQAYDFCCNLVTQLKPEYRKRYFNKEVSPNTKERTAKVQKLLLCMTASTTNKILHSRGVERSHIPSRDDQIDRARVSRLLIESERRARASYELYKHLFPTEIWNCCPKTCFALNASSVDVVHALASIRKTSKEMLAAAGNVDHVVESRRPGVGCSNIAFTAPSRAERERGEGRVGTDRQMAMTRFSQFVESVISFLYGIANAGQGGAHLQRKLCTEAICLLLGVSRNFLYRRNRRLPPSSGSSDASNEVISSIIDTAGMRLRQHRRNGDRRGFPSIADMINYDCGCAEPCYAKVPEWRLQRQYRAFVEISMQAKPRQMEHRYLLNIMFHPLSNSTVRQCDRSIAKLLTLSEGVVGAVRRSSHRMYTDPLLGDRPLLPDWRKHGYSSVNHPANRLDEDMRERIENHLNMVLRPDPSGGDDTSICRVYSPEVNTHEKLRKLLTDMLKSDIQGPIHLSSSSLQRRINEYLEARKLRISYQQTDQNACPRCKTFKHSSFRYHREYKLLQAKLDTLIRQNEGTGLSCDASSQAEIQALRVEVQTKKDQEEETHSNFRSHCGRDRDIRKVVKRMGDLFRSVENGLITKRAFTVSSPPWNCHKQHAIITHQDDMTKVDLPYFVESASADITRWRFDVNAHVSAINGDAVVFSHEQGTGPKNGGCIVEEIILDHLLRSRGESIKIIVSDNASVGKNWLCSIALPQYIVDQGLAKIVLIIFLENNHGKWLADLHFGQLQTRRKRTTILSVDDLLTEFESINRTRGTVQGFALNPLSSIDFSDVLTSLGYESKPPKGFNFTKRNIHFSGAAAPGAKEELSGELKDILGPALPDDPGLVRISSNPPSAKPLLELPYEERYFDVPAARLSQTASNIEEAVNRDTQSMKGTDEVSERADVPLVVPLDKEFCLSGSGVVSHRTAEHVGFNGIGFRKCPAFPELRENETNLVRRAWPSGLLTRGWNKGETSEPRYGTEAVKCAPENWVVRRSLSHMSAEGTDIKARYPPRNLLNARYKKGPRESLPWVPTPTYKEDPFPISEGTCSFNAMRNFSLLHSDAARSVHVLDVLKAVFEDMGRTHQPEICDVWLQNKVTMPCRNAISKYHTELKVFIAREKGYPAGPLTVKRAFKQDAEVQDKLNQVLYEQGVTRNKSKARYDALNRMFQEAENTPGALERFEYVVERDLERCARELKEFQRVQHKFDTDHGLLPVHFEVSPTDKD